MHQFIKEPADHREILQPAATPASATPIRTAPKAINAAAAPGYSSVQGPGENGTIIGEDAPEICNEKWKTAKFWPGS